MTNPDSGKIKKNDITCPHCGKKDTWHENNPARPFCSPRCKLIDLGAWADESRRIPGESTPVPDADSSDYEE